MADFDNTQAHKEGWCISECHCSSNGPYQLQRDDDLGWFPTDGHAWIFTRNKAAAGSEYHIAALDFLKRENPQEYAAIMARKVV